MIEQSYVEGIRRAYRGELIGERLYRTLAGKWNDADCRTKLSAIADVEALTHTALKPIAARLAIEFSSMELQEEITRRVVELGQLSWPRFIERAVADWPSYINEFAAIAALAPRTDQDSLRILVEHERALVAFAELERADIGSMASLKPIEAFLQRN